VDARTASLGRAAVSAQMGMRVRDFFFNALIDHDLFLMLFTCGCVAVNFPPMQIKKHRSMLNHATTSATGGLAQIHSIFLRHVARLLIIFSISAFFTHPRIYTAKFLYAEKISMHSVHKP
jgi:hypothetical protein